MDYKYEDNVSPIESAFKEPDLSLSISIKELFQSKELICFKNFQDYDYSHEETFYALLDAGFLDFTEQMLKESNENSSSIYYDQELHVAEKYMECALLLARAPQSCISKYVNYEFPKILIHSINEFMNDSKLVITALELCSTASDEFCNFIVANEEFPEIIESALKCTNVDIAKSSYSLLCSLLRIPHQIEETEAILQLLYQNSKNTSKIEDKQIIQKEYILKALFYVSNHSFVIIKSNDTYYNLQWALEYYGSSFVEKFTLLIINILEADGLEIIDKLGERNVIKYIIGNIRASRTAKGLNAILCFTFKLLSLHQGYILNLRQGKIVQALYQKMKDSDKMRIPACRGLAHLALFDTRETMETLFSIDGALANIVDTLPMVDVESSGLFISAFAQLIRNNFDNYVEFDFIESLEEYLEEISEESAVYGVAQELLSILNDVM